MHLEYNSPEPQDDGNQIHGIVRELFTTRSPEPSVGG
jgi:hypothetical protein